MTTGGNRLICFPRRSGGCGPGSMACPPIRAEASFLNS